eukprot:2669349-Rhodomonas_salina.1
MYPGIGTSAKTETSATETSNEFDWYRNCWIFLASFLFFCWEAQCGYKCMSSVTGNGQVVGVCETSTPPTPALSICDTLNQPDYVSTYSVHNYESGVHATAGCRIDRNERGSVIPFASMEQRDREPHSTRATDPTPVYVSKRNAMNMLRSGLSKRFDSVYEAYVFFDINGDWSVSLVEMKRRLQNIGMHTPELENFFRSNASDGRVGPIEFVQKLSWHPLKSDVNFAIELAMSRYLPCARSFAR